jgi:xanthine dehydrogenase molybdopterin-binding subunit B
VVVVQIEGAFMNGVGYVMSEEVVEDEVTGSNLTDSTWTYKPPGMAELPQVISYLISRGQQSKDIEYALVKASPSAVPAAINLYPL